MPIPGTNIRLLRQQMGLSLRALAVAAEVDFTSLSRLETGKAGYSEAGIDRIAKALNVSPGVLFADVGVVEAAALRMRQVPLLTEAQLVSWRGIDEAELPEEQAFLHCDLHRTSRFSFALRVANGANQPDLRSGDDLVFDMGRQPKMTEFVAAQDKSGRVYIGRMRELPANDADPRGSFAVVPVDPVYAVITPREAAGLRLRGTLIEYRRYFK